MTLTLTHLLIVGSFLLGTGLMFLAFRIYIGKNIKNNYIHKGTIKNYLKRRSNFNKPKIIKRGLIISDFTWQKAGEVVDGVAQGLAVEVTCEFTVINETSDMYKIRIDEIKVHNWTYGKDFHMESYRKAFSGWFDKTDDRLNLFKHITKKEINIANMNLKYTSDGTEHFFYKPDDKDFTDNEKDDMRRTLNDTGFDYKIEGNHLVIDVEPADVLITYIESATESDYMNL